MGFRDDVASVDAASSSHFVPLSAMMRSRRVSDRPVPGDNRGPEVSQMYPWPCLAACQQAIQTQKKGQKQHGCALDILILERKKCNIVNMLKEQEK